jgi:hypothetical protein
MATTCTTSAEAAQPVADGAPRPSPGCVLFRHSVRPRHQKLDDLAIDRL